MGQDFVARKAAKKQRKRSARDAETGRKQKRKRKEDGFEVAGDDDGLGMTAEQVKRRRKKGNNVSLRISRAACYKPPQLTAEDLDWDGTENGEGGGNTFSMDGLAEAGYDSDVEEAAQKHIKQQPKQSKQQASLKLSTAVNLLNPATAAKLAGMQQQQQKAQTQQRPKQSHQQLDDIISTSPLLKVLNDLGLNPIVARCMAKLGYNEPTPIQSACWGLACAGRDVLGHAEPGSGKTLAYLLPAFAHLLTSSSSSSGSNSVQQQPGDEQVVQPRVLVLLPARELAQQVHAQCTALFSVTGISAAVVYGGVPKEAQVDLLHRRKPQLLVATPGRLLDLVDSSVLDFNLTDCVVLDEADKMLSVGFEPQLQRLQAMLLGKKAGKAAVTETGGKKKGKALRKQQEQAAGTAGQQCQVLLFSATLPKAVRVTADAWLKPGYESVSCSAGADSISRTITQVVHVCAEHKKPTKLLKHMSAIKASSEGLRNPPRVLVFANRIKTVLFVHRTLSEAGYRAVLLHGKRSQAERDAAVADFKAGKLQVLVASDVASRGLDIRGLPYVVNYDFPSNLEVYIHRVGRTGRLAAAGHAFSFFTRPLAKLAAPLVSLLQSHEQPVDPNLVQLAEAWATAEAAIKAQGGSVASLEAAAAAAEGQGEQEEDEGMADAAAGAADVPEDLQEGLSEQQKAALLAAPTAQPDSTQQQQQQQASNRSKKHAGDSLMVPQAPSAAAAGGGADAAAAAAAAPVAFMPAAAFAGAKAGYAFKKGPRGVGYYLDPVQQQQGKQQDKQQRKQEHQKVLQQAMKQYKQQQQQQGQQREQPSKVKKAKVPDVAAVGAVGKAEGSSKAAAPKQRELPPLPGLAQKRKLPAFMTSGDLSDDDDYAGRVMDGGSDGSDGGSGSSDDEGQGSGGQGGRGSLQQRLQRQQLANGGSKRRKALPGRLRKKLAKAAGGGKSGGGGGDGGGGGGGGKGAKGGKGGKKQ